VEVRSWWEDKFYQMSREDHRFTYQDLLSGNLSLDAELFARLDGFDWAFANWGGEDYEFGLRLLKADVSLVLAAEAVGYHYEHETNNLDRSFGGFRQEGRSDVLIGRRHPELRPTLHIKDYETPYFLVDKILVASRFCCRRLWMGWLWEQGNAWICSKAWGCGFLGGGCGQNCAVIGICGCD
jgi:GT2 family glycosyltransferase